MEENIYRVQEKETYTLYTKNGLKHRVEGPALTIDDHNYYYINGEHLTMGEHQHYCKAHKAYCNNNEEEYYNLAKQSLSGIYVSNNE